MEVELELCRTVVRVVAGADGSLSDSQTDHTCSIQDSCEGPIGYEVEGRMSMSLWLLR